MNAIDFNTKESLEQLKVNFPNLDAYVFRLDLNFMTLLFNPESCKVIMLNTKDELPSNIMLDKIDFDFSEAPIQANLAVQFKTQNDDGTIQFVYMNFTKIPLKFYQIKAIID
jgi:hypothetical protein